MGTATLWAGLGAPRLPSLPTLLSLFEKGSKGKSNVTADALLEEVLPAAQLPTDGEVVEEAFSEIRGEESLELPAFAKWISHVCVRLAQEEAKEVEEAKEAEGG